MFCSFVVKGSCNTDRSSLFNVNVTNTELFIATIVLLFYLKKVNKQYCLEMMNG